MDVNNALMIIVFIGYGCFTDVVITVSSASTPDQHKCAPLPIPPNGFVVISKGTLPGSVATYICEPGYELLPSNNSTLTCTETNGWDGWPPVCKLKVTPITLPPKGTSRQTISPTWTTPHTTEPSTGSATTRVITPVTHAAISTTPQPGAGGIKVTQTQPSSSENTSTPSSPTYSVTHTATVTSASRPTPPPIPSRVTPTISTTNKSTVSLTTTVNLKPTTTDEATVKVAAVTKGATKIPSTTVGAPEARETTSYVNVSTSTLPGCGNKMELLNGFVDYSNGTTVGSYATFTCDVGYDMISEFDTPKSKCRPNGKWTYSIPYCKIRDCGNPNNITNGYFNSTNGTVYGSILFYHCNKGYRIEGNSRQTCNQDGNWTGEQPECIEDTSFKTCQMNNDARGFLWPETSSGEVVSVQCNDTPNGTDLIGLAERKCGSNGVWKLPQYNCIRKELKKLENQVNALKVNPSSDAVDSALYDLSSATNVNEKSGALYEGELNSVTNMLETIAMVSSKIAISETQSEAFIGTASNLLDTTNQHSWQAVTEAGTESSGNEEKPIGATRVLEVIDKYAFNLATSVKSQTIEQKNVVLHVSKLDDQSHQKDIHFPVVSMAASTNSSISLGKQNLKDVSSYSAVLYKNLTGILPSDTDKSQTSREYEINSAVLSLDLHRRNSQVQNTQDVTIVLEHFEKDLRYPMCSYWNTKRNIWSSDGCTLQSSNTTISVCKCTHLTNFAILMSPWIEENVVSTAIDIITIVGCSVSLIGLIITIVVHLALWRYLKSDRIVILMNLSIALVISYIIFLAGVDRTENTDACTAVAVLLQYVYLVVFFLMLAEGIELAVTILYVFTTKSRIKWMLPLAWGIPAVIVGISVGVTKTDGYGTKDFCWLSVEDGLIWSFVGPALLIILINLVLLILVMRTMFKARTLSQKSAAERVKTGVRSLCILLPLMGCSWVLGIFYVNKSFSWVQYVFAICNSLQGLVIFIFHCAMNTQIRGALQRRKKKYYDSRSMISSTTKNISLPRELSTYNGNGRLPKSIITSFDSTDDYTTFKNSYFEMNNPSFQRESFSL